MRRYFDLVLDLLEIEDIEGYQKVADVIEANQDASFLFAHRARFLFEAYRDLLRGKLEPEEFVLIGDVESALVLQKDGSLSAEMVIRDLDVEKLPKESILILDQRVWTFMLDTSNQERIMMMLQEAGKQLFLH